MGSLFLIMVVSKLLRVAYGAGFADDGNTDLTRIGHLILDTLSDIE